MKIAVPLHEGRFCEHFGGAEAFAFYAVDEASNTISDRLLGAPPEHGRGVYPMWLREHGATVVLAGGMGPRAAEILIHQGIDVVLGVRGEDSETIVRSYLAGTLETTGQVCNEHGFHDCSHDHGPDDHGKRCDD